MDFLEDGDDNKEKDVEEMVEVAEVDATCGQDRPYLALVTRNKRLTAEDHFQVFKFGKNRCFFFKGVNALFALSLGHLTDRI